MNYFIAILISISISGLDIYLAKNGIVPIQPSLFNFLTCLLIIAVNKDKLVWNKHMNYIMFAFIVLATYPLFQSVILINEANIDPTFLFLPSLGAIIVASTSIFFYIHQVEKKHEIIYFSLLLAYFIIFGSLLIDIIAPSTFSKLSTRAAGINRNPNNTYIRLILITIGLLTLTKTKKNKILLLTLMTIGVLLTLSRGGLVLTVLVWIVLIATKFETTRKKLLSVNSAFTIVLILTPIYLIKDLIYDILTSIDAFSNPTSKSRIDKLFGKSELFESNDARIGVTKDYLELIMDRPILGYGAGFSSDNNFIDLATHNVYTRLWVEIGIIGLLMYLCIIITIGILGLRYKRPYLILLSIIVMLMGFFTNTLVDSRTVLIIIPICVIFNIELDYDKKGIKKA